MKASWSWIIYRDSPRQDDPVTADCHLAECFHGLNCRVSASQALLFLVAARAILGFSMASRSARCHRNLTLIYS